MKRCIYCGKKINNDEPICPHCGKNMNSNSLNNEEIHNIIRNSYKEITKNQEKRDSSLSFLVIGGILLVVFSIFLVLSFRYNTAKIKVFNPTSIEFVVSMICGSLSLILISVGTIRLTIATNNLRFYKSVMKEFDKKI